MYEKLYNSYNQQQKYAFRGPEPFGFASFAKSNCPYTRSAICDFTSEYRKRLSTEWAPVSMIRPDPPLLIQPNAIYHKHIGQIPKYAGHIPGAMFRYFAYFGFLARLIPTLIRYGRTFGNDSRDAKRWLRGDFSI